MDFHPRTVLVAWLKGTLLSVSILAGCGSDPVQMRRVPSADEVRAFWGLQPGNCWKYMYSMGSVPLFSTVSVRGPDSVSIAGATVYVTSYLPESGGLPSEDFLEANANAELRLLRHTEGQAADRVVKRYESEPRPLFVEASYDASGQVVLDEGSKFEAVATPKDGVAESHVWTVLSANESVTTPDGLKTGYKLQYSRGPGSPAVFSLVPGFGFAKFTEFNQRAHQVCAARVCDALGACVGADSCTNLLCP